MTTSQAAQEIKTLAGKVKGILDLAAALEKIGSVENAEREARNRVGNAQKEEADAVQKAREARAELTSINGSIVEARQKARGVEEKAKTDAEDIIAKAKVTALEIVEAAEGDRDEVFRQMREANKKLTTMEAQLEAKTEELETIQKQIGEAHSKIVAFVKPSQN